MALKTNDLSAIIAPVSAPLRGCRRQEKCQEPEIFQEPDLTPTTCTVKTLRLVLNKYLLVCHRRKTIEFKVNGPQGLNIPGEFEGYRFLYDSEKLGSFRPVRHSFDVLRDIPFMGMKVGIAWCLSTP